MEVIEKYKGRYTGEEIDELLGRISAFETGVGGGDKTEEYIFMNASKEWEIEHSLDKYPSVSVVELYTGEEVVADVKYINKSKIIVSFTKEMKGRAYLN